MITQRALACHEVPGVEMLLQYHRIPYVRAEVAFYAHGVVVDNRHASQR